jgi:hypothetical protein
MNMMNMNKDFGRKTKRKATQLLDQALDTIGFLKYVYKERVTLHKMYKMQSIEKENIKRVVQLLGRSDKELRKAEALKARALAPESVVKTAELLDSVDFQEEEEDRERLDYKFAGVYTGPVAGSDVVPQMNRDHEKNRATETQ